MTALPKAVQEQLDAANALQESLAAPLEAPQAPIQEPTVVTPPAEPSVTQAATPATEPAKDADYWRRRFEIIEGKYRAEVPNLHQTVRQQEAQLQQLTGRLDQLSRTPAPETKPQPLVTAQDEEKFGADLIDAMRRVVREESRTGLQALSQRLEAVEALARSTAPKADRVAAVEQELVQTREQRFFADLMREVPDVQAVNADERFLKWLTVLDPITGLTRQDALSTAERRLDADHAARIFKAFKAELAAEPPSQQQQAKAELERQVAPSKSARTTVTPPAPARYTVAQYQYWFDQRRQNDTPKAELEANRAELDRAVAENRIDW
jgi:hypothetical protein